jgi:cytochrome b561
MQGNASAPLDRYDRTTIALHWVTAGLVVLLWGSAQIIDYFAKGAPRWNMLSVHMALGLTLAVIMLRRVTWRLTTGQRLPDAEAGILGWLARSTHLVLYALLIVQIALGIANAWVRGDHVFTWFVIPAFDPADKVLRKDVGQLHALFANLILIVAGLHAAAGLFHHYVMRDGVLRRMLPQGRTP